MSPSYEALVQSEGTDQTLLEQVEYDLVQSGRLPALTLKTGEKEWVAYFDAVAAEYHKVKGGAE